MKQNTRNHGIDLLRIVAMSFVVLLHQLLKSGGLEFTENMSVYRSYWLFEVVAYGAVNMFAIISGYAGYRDTEKERKWSSLLSVWAQAVFYGVIISLVFKLSGTASISWHDVAMNAFPISTNRYWYLTSYVGLFVLMPIIDSAVRTMSNDKLIATSAAMLVFFSVIEVFTGADFQTLGGYSVIWLSIMYFFGATIKKCGFEEKITTGKCILAAAALVLITWLSKIFPIDFNVFGQMFKINDNTLVSYCSPTIIAISVLFVLIFSRLRISEKVGETISTLSSGAFAAYLINTDPNVWAYILPWQAPYMGEKSTLWLLATSIIFCVLFVAASIAIDLMRAKLFKIARIDRLLALPDRLLRKKMKVN